MNPTSEPTVDQATRIVAGSTRAHYDPVSMAFHWLTVVLVLLLFALAETWDFAARPMRHLLIVAHMSLGIILSAVVVGRIAWRLIPGHQVDPAVTGWVERASKAMHYLLYAMLLLQAVLGYVVRWAGNEAMSFFGLLIPPPFAEFSRPTHHLLTEIHDWLGWAIIIVALGHALAALYHHFVLHDKVLVRMLPGRNRLGGPSSPAPR
jgi:cytochrome b561